MRFAVTLLLLAGCDVALGLDVRDAGPIDEALEPDARICEVGAPFVSMGDVPIDGTYSVEAARFSPDQTSAYLSLCTLGQPTSTCDLYLSLYMPVTNELSSYVPLGVNSAFYDSYGTVTPDGMYLVFGSRRTGTTLRTYISTKSQGKFVTAAELSLIPTVSYVNEPYLSTDGQMLYLAGPRSAARRVTTSIGPVAVRRRLAEARIWWTA